MQGVRQPRPSEDASEALASAKGHLEISDFIRGPLKMITLTSSLLWIGWNVESHLPRPNDLKGPQVELVSLGLHLCVVRIKVCVPTAVWDFAMPEGRSLMF